LWHPFKSGSTITKISDKSQPNNYLTSLPISLAAHIEKLIGKAEETHTLSNL
jgi:hypothetical protein